ncbi:MAG: hypothetical protein ACXW3E_01050 [Thermoanaerobaculia bacterium]
MVVRDEVASLINIHNGDVMAVSAKREGIPGEHLAFRESLVTGPVSANADSLATRARFLSAAYGEELLRASNNLFQQEQSLNAAVEQDEIVLWFEHDLFCLVHFVYLLQRFRGRNVSFIWSSEALVLREPADLYELFNSRTPATPAVCDTAARSWSAFTSPDPRTLNDVFTSASADISFLREGFRLHASRFPSLSNGLGSVENRLLNLIAAGAGDFASLFPQFDAQRPRFGYGDVQVLAMLRELASRAVPLITMIESDETPPKATFAITPAGENVMSGSVDDVAINDPDFWLGGAHVTKESVWRWDESRGEIILSRPRVS